MNFLNSLSNNIKNVFVGSHRGEDLTDKWFDDYGRPHNPLDDMPIANGTNRYAPPEKLAELESISQESNPRPEEDVAEWFKDENVEESNTSEEIVEEKETIHEKLYRMATAKYNPFAIGGSESIHDFEGGSENVQKL